MQNGGPGFPGFIDMERLRRSNLTLNPPVQGTLMFYLTQTNPAFQSCWLHPCFTNILYAQDQFDPSNLNLQKMVGIKIAAIIGADTLFFIVSDQTVL